MNKNQLTRRYLAHLGAIFTHLGIAGLVYSLCAFFSGLLVLGYILLLFVIALGTVFLAFAVPEYRAMWDNIDHLSNMVLGLYNSLAVVLPVSIVLMATALVFLMMDKGWEKSKGKIITNIVILSIMAVIFVVFLIGLASKK